MTGEIRILPVYEDKGGRTEIPIEMTGLGSCFIVFTDQVNEKTGRAQKENFPEFQTFITVDGIWTVDFQNKDIGPTGIITMDILEDWTTFEDYQVKFYSGKAVYATTFNIDEIPADDLFINLGEVGVMAEVKINGQEIGGTWMSPFRLNTGDFLKTGENRLEVEVVNVWRNRLIGDKMLHDEEGYTWLLVDDIKPGEKLRASGLIGPVYIEVYKGSISKQNKQKD
jgi:hypothetical protein